MMARSNLPIGSEVDAYGPDNIKLKSCPVDHTFLDSIALGKEANVFEGFGLKTLGIFEFRLKPIGDFDSKSAKFKVNIK